MARRNETFIFSHTKQGPNILHHTPLRIAFGEVAKDLRPNRALSIVAFFQDAQEVVPYLVSPSDRLLCCRVQRCKRGILPILVSGSQILHPGSVREALCFRHEVSP